MYALIATSDLGWADVWLNTSFTAVLKGLLLFWLGEADGSGTLFNLIQPFVEKKAA